MEIGPNFRIYTVYGKYDFSYLLNVKIISNDDLQLKKTIAIDCFSLYMVSVGMCEFKNEQILQ